MSAEAFERDGYLVAPALLDADACSALLADVVSGLGREPESYVHEARLRRHTPIALTQPMRSALGRAAAVFAPVLTGFLGGRTQAGELSAVTVFPGAAAQRAHHDELALGKRFATIFINLTPTRGESGALVVYPGSHQPPLPNERGAPEVLALPVGSAVLINGKLRHGGGANATADAVRPVLYVSFGDLDIPGPVYSIAERYRRKLKLEHFLPRPFTADEQVRLRSDLTVLAPLAGTPDALVLQRGGEADERLTVSASELALLTRLAAGPVRAGDVADAAALQTLWLAGLLA